MALKIISPKESAISQGIKMLVHGPAGSGKTVLGTTAGVPTLIISAEAGLLSIQDAPDYVQAVEVSTVEDVAEVYDHLKAGTDYQWVVLDSVSEIAEVVLSKALEATQHAMKAYGEMASEMSKLIRAFRDLSGYNVMLTAKQERIKDDASSTIIYAPSMPGSKLGQALPYWFDLVLAYRVEKDAEGNPDRWLQTSRDLQFEAKDRSGRLDMYERPNLKDIAAKIRGTAKAKAA